MRALMLVLVLGIAPAAYARAPAGQGKACDAKNACSAGLACVAHAGGKSTCELVCAASTKCPEDQRCVKDGAASVCRPINDGVGL
ncbi:MAG TPA: hypothetical protein VN947_29190 [Polyangia bacterium]|nr:hypothetical protein [Polyangia bacterium]